MISLWMFFVFAVEVLGGFRAWFQQSFWTSELKISSRCLCCLGLSIPKISSNALGRLLFIGVWGWVSDTWRSLISDTCHSLIGLLMSSFTRAGLHMSSLTRARLLMSSLTRADVWLVFAWQLANFCWFLSSDSKT